MINITVIGSGNLASHIVRLQNVSSDIIFQQVSSRHLQKIPNNADVYILAVSDSAIAEVSDQLPFEGKLVVHTAGGQSMDVLSSKNRKGVWYPLQTFSKDKEIDFKSIPICIEADVAADYRILEAFSNLISYSVYRISSEQRKALHVSAVFVNNFVNHLYQIGNQICEREGLSFDLLKPLIQETAHKMNYLLPQNAQTGPAKRSDEVTIQTHLSYIQDIQEKKIYQLITAAIQQTHVKKL